MQTRGSVQTAIIANSRFIGLLETTATEYAQILYNVMRTDKYLVNEYILCCTFPKYLILTAKMIFTIV